MTKPDRTGDSISMTQTLRNLSVPLDSANDLPGLSAGKVLVLCRDAAARKWLRRWLAQDNLSVMVADHPEQGLQLARSQRPDVIIVEANLRDLDGAIMYRVIADAADVRAEQIVLCASTKEVGVALEIDIYDVARKPFDWTLVSRRARIAARQKRTERDLRERGDSLETALSVANSAREQLRSRDTVDPLTGMPNQRKFGTLISNALHVIEGTEGTLVVSVVGFNRFRLIIEAMGQDQADTLLSEVGRKLQECAELAGEVLDQPGGLRTAAAANLDQFRFALMYTCDRGDKKLNEFQVQLLEFLSEPVQVAGQTVYLSPCIGTAIYPDDADNADALLQRADNAMREAQGRGGGFRFYCPEIDAAAAHQLKIEHMLHEALDQRELTLAYQPIVTRDGSRLLAAEALLRWRQPDGNYISPAEFIPIAEESDLILRVGSYVLDEACRQLDAWREAGIPVPRVCVNVAKAQLLAGDFVHIVKDALDRYGLKPDQLELEISERGVIAGDADVIQHLERLYELGVRLAIDDFGSGDAAIAYLKEMPVHVLKLDRSYTAGLTACPKDQAIVSAAIVLGRKLGLRVVAEGVETKEQLALLRDLNCEAVQGFLIARPVHSDAFVALLGKPRNS